MIREFYVFQRSGNPVFHKSYGEKRVDEALLSGFLAAVFSFAKEIGHGEIQSMVMKDTVFVYEVAGDLIFAVAVDIDDDENAARSFLSQAISLFSDFYKGREEQAIDFFGEILGPLIIEYNSRLMVKEVFCTPFLISDEEESEEVSLAVAFLMLEKMKGQRIGLLKRKSVYIRSVAKILWPFWIVPAEAGSCLIVDGLFREPITIKCFSPPDLKEEDLISSKSDPLKAIDKIARTLKEKGTYETFSIPGLVGYEYVQELTSFFSYARTSKVKDAAILSPIIGEAEVNGVKEKFLEVLKAVKENAEKLKIISEKVVETAETHIKSLEEEKLRIENEYLEKIEKLKQEISEEKRKAEKEKSQIRREIGEWACQMAGRDVENAKEGMISLSSFMTSVINFVSSSLKASEGEEDKLGLLEEFVSLLEKLKSEMKNVSEDIRRVEKAVRLVINEAQKKYQVAEQQIEKKILNMEKRVDDVKREMEVQLSSISRVKEKYREKLKGIYSYLEKHLKSHEADIATLTGSMTKTFNFEGACVIYLVAYIAELNENGNTQTMIIPPVNLTKKLEEKVKMDDVASRLMMSFLKKRFEEHLRERWFAEEVRRILDEMNLLKQRELEPKIYDGLNSLLQREFITKKEFSLMKMSMIELFREKPK
ncbi:MAG: hypothetical protein QXN15_08025 [Candidatus Jordarchaeales archaeon]|nr:hypothetical protein [Candidatus Jordarchaeia archaeon]